MAGEPDRGDVLVSAERSHLWLTELDVHPSGAQAHRGTVPGALERYIWQREATRCGCSTYASTARPAELPLPRWWHPRLSTAPSHPGSRLGRASPPAQDALP